MADVLIAADADYVADEVVAALPEADGYVRRVTSGSEVVAAVVERRPDVAVIDLQIGNMGGMAACLELHLEEGAGRLPHVPVLMLLDRRPDVFLARRSQAEGWLVKPLDPIRLRRAINALMAGSTYHDDSRLPTTVAVPTDQSAAP